jgi:hypothetical protein
MEPKGKNEDARKAYTVDNETFFVENESQSEFIRKLTEFCNARNELEQFLLEHLCWDIESNRVSDSYEPIINYSALYSVNFLKAEPNLRAVKWIKSPNKIS